ncbi:hypothetical protein BURMUCGD1_4511 [Burkholderia multivorans CGD1]|nr:hypothetical protein BURMUCGD1_4511 [Burkholderia multivorans CGD1]
MDSEKSAGAAPAHIRRTGARAGRRVAASSRPHGVAGRRGDAKFPQV